MRKYRWIKRVLIAVIILGAIALCQDDEPTIQQALYCEMTELYQETDGQHGWPDYKNLKGKNCND